MGEGIGNIQFKQCLDKGKYSEELTAYLKKYILSIYFFCYIGGFNLLMQQFSKFPLRSLPVKCFSWPGI